MNNKTLSNLIENEIHATHSISDALYSNIKNVVESIPDINKPFDIRDKQLTSAMTLNPLAFKLFQYFVATLDHVIPESQNNVIRHLSNVVLIKAYKFFPDYPEIFITYAIRRIINDRDEFINECMTDKIKNVENKSTKAGNLLAFLMFVLILGVIVSCINSIHNKLNNSVANVKQIKKQFKHELKEVKKKLKQKYNLDD